MSRWLTKWDENLITVMPECFYRASSVFCDTGENKKTLDSRLKTAGMTILIKEVFSGEITSFNMVIVSLHFMKSQCDYDKVDYLVFFDKVTAIAVQYILSHTEFKF